MTQKTDSKSRGKTKGSEVAVATAPPPFSLPQKRITIKFYPKASAMVQDERHELFGRLGPKAQKGFQLPRTERGSWVNPFEGEPVGTREHLEKMLNFPTGWLNTTALGACFFDDYFVKLGKQDEVFDLSKPDDYLRFLVTKAQTDKVAPSREDVHKLNTYMWYIEDNEIATSQKRKLKDKRAKAYALLGSIEDNPARMRHILMERRGKSNLPERANDPDWLFNELSDLIDNNKIDGASRFLEIANDPNLPIKADIYMAVSKGIIKQKGRFFYDEEDQPIMAPGTQNDLNGAISFLTMDENSDYYALLKQRIQNAN